VVMPSRDLEARPATDTGEEELRRPTVVPGPVAADPEVSERPRRRTFTAQEKLRILKEADQATGIGAISIRQPCLNGAGSAMAGFWARSPRPGAGRNRQRPIRWRWSWLEHCVKTPNSSAAWIVPRGSSRCKKNFRICWGFR
jgi:hypothetical protein